MALLQAEIKDQSLDEVRSLLRNIRQLGLLDETLTMSAQSEVAADGPKIRDQYRRSRLYNCHR